MSIKARVLHLGRGLRSLLYPTLCLNCRRPVTDDQRPQLCVGCAIELSETRYWELPENAVTDRLRGRLDLVSGTALYHFNVGSVCQSLIHALKYYRRPEIGAQLGERLGERLKGRPLLADLAGIVPVPIHPARRETRGYNQAEMIADGLAGVLGVPVYPNALRRTSFSGSQTKKSRFERVQNVASVFRAYRGDFAGRHLLLVDDVLTTGATLDFCGNALLEAHEGCRVSIATLAIAGGG